jgi:hypothetical protein
MWEDDRRITQAVQSTTGQHKILCCPIRDPQGHSLKYPSSLVGEEKIVRDVKRFYPYTMCVRIDRKLNESKGQEYGMTSTSPYCFYRR